MAATIWKGRITFGLVSVPVRLLSATQPHDIRFHYLHDKDMSRIGMEYYCKKDGKVVKRNELVKGYEHKKNEYIVIEPEELKRIEPESSSNLNIDQFIDINEIDPVYFERSYYLAPDEEGTEKTFGLLARAMESKNRAAIGKLLMRDHEYLALIRPARGGLVLNTMHFPDEIKKNQNTVKKDLKIREKEMNLAELLVDNLTEPFDPSRYKDEYTERVQQLIEAKMKGKKLHIAKPRAKKPIPNLLEALEKSVRETEKARKRTA